MQDAPPRSSRPCFLLYISPTNSILYRSTEPIASLFIYALSVHPSVYLRSIGLHLKGNDAPVEHVTNDRQANQLGEAVNRLNPHRRVV